MQQYFGMLARRRETAAQTGDGNLNRISKAWESLGRARQVAFLLLVVLSLLQAVLLILAEQGWLLPLVALVTLLGIVLIKQSAATRDAVTRLTDTPQSTERPVVVSQPDTRPALGLLREQVGRTVAQFTWLGERTLEMSERISAVERIAHEALSGINAQHERLIAMKTEITTAYGDLSAAVAVGGDQLTASVAETRAELSSAVVAVDTRLARALDGGNSHSLERRVVAEISALALLNTTADVPHLPPFDSWAMSPLAVRLMRSLACKLGPESTIVELGSGVSTAWIAYALSQQTSPAKYIAIDHSEVFASKTQMHLDDMRVAAAADVVLAPLQAVEINGESFNWYATGWIAGVSNIGLLVVDGPPAGRDTGARYPALPLLVDKLADDATIIVDDIDRPGESDMLAKWLTVPGVTMTGPVGRSAILNYSRRGEASE